MSDADRYPADSGAHVSGDPDGGHLGAGVPPVEPAVPVTAAADVPGSSAADGSSAPPPGTDPPTTPTGGTYPLQTGPTTNVLSIVSLVAGITSYVLLPFLGAVAGIITGHMALSQLRRKPEQGRSLAITGLILSYVNVALGALVFVLFLLLFVFAAVFGHGFSSSFGDSQRGPGYQRCMSQAQDQEQLQRCLDRYTGFDDSRFDS